MGSRGREPPVRIHCRGDRQGRAADHRPRPARAVRLPARATVLEAASGWAACSWCRSGRAGCSAWSSRSPRRATCRRSGSPSRSRRSRPTCRRTSCGSGCGSPRSTARRPRAGWRWCCRRARAPAAERRDHARASRSRRDAHRRPGGRRSTAASGSASRQRAGLEALADGPLRVSRPGPRQRLRPRQPAAARGARPRSTRATRSRRRGARPIARRRRARRRRQPDRRRRRRRWPRSSAGWPRTTRPDAGCCCTASPAAARPRSTCAPSPRRSSAARPAIVLVPEIALTPQTAGRFVERFGDTVAVLHSQLTARERYDEWPRLRSGEARVVRRAALGRLRPARGPRPDRGRRGARRLLQAGGRPALRRPPRRRAPRARGCGALLLAGSATPRPESVLRYDRVRLPERVDGRAAAAGRAGRHGGRQGPAAPAHARRARAGPARRREGDRAAQPARLVELPLLRRLRPRLGVPELRRDAGAAPAARAGLLPPLRPPRARCPTPAPTAARSRSRATASAPSSSASSSSG